MGSTAGQLLLGMFLTVAVLFAVVAGVVLLAWTPLSGASPQKPAKNRHMLARRASLRLGHIVNAAGRRWSTGLRAPVGHVVRHPARLVVAGFAGAVLLGTALLSLPLATESGQRPPVVTALFTSTSAVCVTGLVIEDTGTYWSVFGQVVILALIQIGGLGIMTLASLLGLLVARRLRIRLQLGTQAETKAIGVGEVRRVVVGVLRISLLAEAVVATVLTWRFAAGYDISPGRSVYLGIFHAVSAFNNAGFGLYADSLVRFVTDPLICLPIAAAVIIGGLGFPVLLELRHELRRPRRWSLHTKITVGSTLALLAIGWAVLTVAEWSNNATLAPLSTPGKLLAGFTAGVMPRTAGFNSLDIAGMNDFTLAVTDMLMFVGGGSAGTAGGIKVTTFALLAFVVLAELRGEPSVHALGRKLPAGVQRQALTVVLLSIAAVAVSTLALLALTPYGLDQVLFEVTSAFATVGLSTGITPHVGTAGHAILILLMFIGRLGPITAVTALALRERTRRYERPEERPLVG